MIGFYFYREHPYNVNKVSFPEEAFSIFDAKTPETLGKSINSEKKTTQNV